MFSIEGFKSTFGFAQMFWEGVVCTVSMSALTVLFGFVLALLLATMRMCRFKPLRAVATAYVEFFRATPLIVQLFLI